MDYNVCIFASPELYLQILKFHSSQKYRNNVIGYCVITIFLHVFVNINLYFRLTLVACKHTVVCNVCLRLRHLICLHNIRRNMISVRALQKYSIQFSDLGSAHSPFCICVACKGLRVWLLFKCVFFRSSTKQRERAQDVSV